MERSLLPVLLIFSIVFSGLVAYDLWIWFRFRRMTMEDRYSRRALVKGRIFVKYPALNLVTAIISIAVMILIWKSALNS